MTEIQLLRLNWLLENTLQKCNRNFRTKNTIGRKLYGNYYIGRHENNQFYIKLSFLVIAFFPLLPTTFYLTFINVEDCDEHIIGELPLKKLRESSQKFGIDIKRIIFSGYLSGFFKGSLSLIIFIIITFLAISIVYFVFSFIN